MILVPFVIRVIVMAFVIRVIVMAFVIRVILVPFVIRLIVMAFVIRMIVVALLAGAPLMLGMVRLVPARPVFSPMAATVFRHSVLPRG